MLRPFIAVCVGGALGSALRYATVVWFSKIGHHAFPFATMLVNIVGCFLIGMAYAFAERYQWFSPHWRLFIITGFCGGLTTFSAFAYENIKLLQQGNVNLFLLYSVGSFVISLIAVVAGVYCTRLW